VQVRAKREEARVPPSGDGVHVRSVGPTMQPWAVAVDNSGLAYLPFYFYFLINLLFFCLKTIILLFFAQIN